MTPKRIVILGGGFGGTTVYRELHRHFHKEPIAKISMVSETNYFLFTPLLHEVATGGVNPQNVTEPLREVIGCCMAAFHESKVLSIDREKRIVTTDEEHVPYDYLVLALGSTSKFYNVPGAEKNSWTLKTLEDAISLKNHFIKTVEDASERDEKEREEMLHFVVVGGGPTGVELVAEMHEFLMDTLAEQYDPTLIKPYIKITIVQKGDELVKQFDPRVRRRSLKALEQKHIQVLLNEEIDSVSETHVHLKKMDKPLRARTVIWAAGIQPNEVKFVQNVERLPNGMLIVRPTLQLKDDPNIFAIGDMAAMRSGDSPVPATAQAAEKAAKTAAHNIHNLIIGKPVKPFSFSPSGMLLSLGKLNAVAELKYFVFSGSFAWWLWRTIYLTKIISWRKRLIVMIDWTFNLFSARDISRF